MYPISIKNLEHLIETAKALGATGDATVTVNPDKQIQIEAGKFTLMTHKDGIDSVEGSRVIPWVQNWSINSSRK